MNPEEVTADESSVYNYGRRQSYTKRTLGSGERSASIAAGARDMFDRTLYIARRAFEQSA